MEIKRYFGQFEATTRSQTGHTRISLPLAALCLLLFFLDISPAYADAPTFDDPRLFGTGSDLTKSVAVGDVNGDGALDIVVGDYEGQDAIYLNDGAGNFDWSDAAQNFGPEPGGGQRPTESAGDVLRPGVARPRLCARCRDGRDRLGGRRSMRPR